MARLKRLEHEIIVPRHSLEYGLAPERWCKQHFGPEWDIFDNPQGRWKKFWAGRDAPNCYRWCFADERDLAWFALRWS